MKKLLCILTILSILFCSASCGVDRPASSNVPPTQETESTPSQETLGPSISSSDHPDDIYLRLSSLEEYEEYFTGQGGYPDGFIPYDSLSFLGEFDRLLVDISSGDDSNYSYYLYSILHPSGVDFSVTVYPEWLPQKRGHWDIASVKRTMSGSDLRTNGTSEMRGTVLIEDVLYTYLLGKLHSVQWIFGSQEISISGDFDQISEVSEDTLIGRLLNYNTAKGAIAELKQITRSGGREYKGIYTFEEYQKYYISASGNSNGFICYDDLKWLGNFNGFVELAEIPTYFIRHPSGVDFTVHIYPEHIVEQLGLLDLIWQVESVRSTLAGSDLRVNGTTKDLGTILLKGALYTYISGKLKTIVLVCGGQQIRIYGDFDQLPATSDAGFLGKLLDIRYAEPAISDLHTSLDVG